MEEIKRKRALFIYNPKSGYGAIKLYLDNIIERAQREQYELVIYRVNKKGEMTEYIKNYVTPEMYERVLISGGDGTLNECVSNIVQYNLNVPISILPFGTANDFASTLGIQGKIDDILDIAFGKDYREIDVCKVNDQYFINVCAMGMFAGTSHRISYKLKKQFGKYAYYIRALGDIVSYPEISLMINTRKCVIEDKYILILLLNGSGAGGFNYILDKDSLEDGEVDLICIKPVSIYNLLNVFLSIVRGQYKNHPLIDYLKSNECTIKSLDGRELFVDIDGEKGPVMPLRVEVIHKAIKVFST